MWLTTSQHFSTAYSQIGNVVLGCALAEADTVAFDICRQNRE
jgi:hypothetical protein